MHNWSREASHGGMGEGKEECSCLLLFPIKNIDYLFSILFTLTSVQGSSQAFFCKWNLVSFINIHNLNKSWSSVHAIWCENKKHPQKSSWFGILQNIIGPVNGRTRPEPTVLPFMCWENKARREAARSVKDLGNFEKKIVLVMFGSLAILS